MFWTIIIFSVNHNQNCSHKKLSITITNVHELWHIRLSVNTDGSQVCRSSKFVSKHNASRVSTVSVNRKGARVSSCSNLVSSHKWILGVFQFKPCQFTQMNLGCVPVQTLSVHTNESKVCSCSNLVSSHKWIQDVFLFKPCQFIQMNPGCVPVQTLSVNTNWFRVYSSSNPRLGIPFLSHRLKIGKKLQISKCKNKRSKAK